MPMSKKENGVYLYNRHDDHKALRNHPSGTFVVRLLHGVLNHYPLAAQRDRRYKLSQAKRKEKNIDDWKAEDRSKRKFLQSKRTRRRFRNGTKNYRSVFNFRKISNNEENNNVSLIWVVVRDCGSNPGE